MLTPSSWVTSLFDHNLFKPLFHCYSRWCFTDVHAQYTCVLIEPLTRNGIYQSINKNSPGLEIITSTNQSCAEVAGHVSSQLTNQASSPFSAFFDFVTTQTEESKKSEEVIGKKTKEIIMEFKKVCQDKNDEHIDPPQAPLETEPNKCFSAASLTAHFVLAHAGNGQDLKALVHVGFEKNCTAPLFFLLSF
jgi:hypothetical protein